MTDADDAEHPAVQRAAELLAELSGRDVDEHAAVLEQAHAQLQYALSEADRPTPPAPTEPTGPGTSAGSTTEVAT